ncbi:MAG TPA: GEVED domain-containing protein [Edaphocola sp.]|nr:GEVED domain-containing protein [Edaphocola sp.]
MKLHYLSKIKNAMLGFALLVAGNSVYAQTTLNTTVGSTGYTGTNSSGTGYGITFAIQNTTSSPILLTDVGDWTQSSDNGNLYSLYYSTSPLSGSPPSSFPAAGWTLVDTNTVNNISATSLSVNTVMDNMTFLIPGNTTYHFSLVTSGTRRYSGTGVGTCTPDSFESAGIKLLVGDYMIGGQYVGWSATNNPRFFTGSITFVPASPCTAPPTAGAANASNHTPCIGQGFGLSLTGASFGTGMTYQWQSATSASGPWTNINGATSSSYAVPAAVSGTTYYRNSLTCSGQTSYSSYDSVVVANGFPGGTYTINPALPASSTNFQTMGAAVSAISCGITGPIVFNMATGNTFNEQITLPSSIGATATNTVTFNGNGDTVKFTGTASQPWTIGLDGADYFTFNNLVVQGEGNYALAMHLWNNADHNNFNGCTFIAPENGTNSFQIPFSVSGSATSGTTSGNSGSYNTVDSCTMISGYYNTVFVGASGNNSEGNQLLNSTLRDFYFYGSYNTYQTGLLVKNNNLSRPNRTTLSSFYGVYFSTGVDSSTIEKNRIQNQFGGNSSYSGTSYNIYVSSTATGVGTENKIINNVIGNVNGNSSVYGIYMPSAIHTQVYYNTVSIDNAAATTGTVYGIYSTGTSGGIDIKNNNISITQGGSGTKYCLYFSSSANGKSSNNNNLYMGSTSGTNNIGYLSGAQATMAAWQAAGGGVFDQNSVSVDPLFVSAAAGNFTPGNAGMNNLGTPIAGITTDFTGATRSATTPDMGAYEFTVAACTGTVDAGTANAPTSVCANISFNLVSTGTSLPALNLTGNWQSAPSPTGPWTNITGATQASYTVGAGISAPTSYRYWMTCSTNSSTDTSNVVSLTINPANQCYCTPPPPSNSGLYWLESVTTTGGTTNISNLLTGASATGYANYTTTDTVSGVAGSGFNFEVKSQNGSSPGIKIWIDWDQSGSFDAGEEVYSSSAGTSSALNTYSGTINIPTTAAIGSTRMRVRNYSSPTPCGQLTYGEAEDYTVTVIAPVPCAGTVDAGTASGPTGVCATIAFTLVDSGATAYATGISYNWQSSPAGANTWTNIAGATNSTYVVTGGISTATDYRYFINCSNSGSSDSSNVIAITLNPANQCYCTPIYTTNCAVGDDISNVTLTGVTTNINNSTGCSPNGYGDYTATVAPADLNPGDSFDLKVSTSYGSPTSEDATAWIDYNQNGAFDTNEVIFNTGTSGLASGGTTQTFLVPATQAAGLYRMRVRVIWLGTTPLDPCAQATYGETEDYMVQIGPPCPLTTPTLGADTTICANDPITLDAGTQPAGATYAWSNGASTQTISVNTAGTYSVAVSDAGGICTKYDTITIAVNPAPVVDLGADTTLCNGGPYIANAGGTANFTYLWTPGGETTNTKTISTSGTYSVAVTNSLGCTTSDTINVTIGELPSVTGITTTGASPTFNFEPNNPLNVTSYLWDFGDGDTSTLQNASHTYTPQGSAQVYTVCLTVSNECGEQQVCTNVTVDGTSIKDLNLSSDILKLYPNPTAQTVTIDNHSGYQMKNIVITNVLGQQVMKIAVKSNKQVINVSELVSGLYQVTIEFEEGTVNRKLEVIK